jgi:Arc/MetJ-type ribon-helix-helix transcriptional regulator
MVTARKVVSAKVEREVAEAVKKAAGEHPERFRDASSVVREAVVELLRSLGYLRA